jgi:glycosyltransferase involved in cell wall biosynthesis
LRDPDDAVRGQQGTARELPRGLSILHVDTGRTWRGGQRQVLLLAQALEQRGYRCTIATPPESALQRRARSDGIATVSVSPRADLDLFAALQLRHTTRQLNPDLVHAHDARAHAVALLALLGSTVPLVVTRRVTFPPRGKLKYGARVDHFVAVSHAVGESLRAAGISSHRVSVVHSGVPRATVATPVDWRERCGWPADAVVCGMAGAMTGEKGVADLAAIARALPVETVRRCRLVLIGGHDAPRDIELCALRGFAAGFLEDARAGLAGLDLLWHPARAEGLGTILLDAMALGVPQVAYEVGGIPEVVRHGETGLLVPAGVPAAFAEAVTRLVHDPSLRARLAAGSRERAEQFSVERMAEGNVAVYNSVLSRLTR